VLILANLRPSNITRRRRDYAPLSNVEVHPLYLAEQDLTASRMLAIMGCDNLEVCYRSTRQFLSDHIKVYAAILALSTYDNSKHGIGFVLLFW